jgi:hypothetical protein
MPDNTTQGQKPLSPNPPTPKNVLGDSPKPLPTNDSTGRGRKGKAHGSIAIKTITRTRKSGQVRTYQQAWYQWQDKTGKHCRYLKLPQLKQVQTLLDRGALVPEILALLAKAPETTPSNYQQPPVAANISDPENLPAST